CYTRNAPHPFPPFKPRALTQAWLLGSQMQSGHVLNGTLRKTLMRFLLKFFALARAQCERLGYPILDQGERRALLDFQFATLSLTMLSCLRRNTGLLLATLSLGLSSLLLASVPSDWKTLAPGMNLKYFAAKHPSSVGDSRILILRMDPSLWQLETVGI